MPAVQGKVARIRYTAATPTSSTDQAATLAGDGLSVTIDSTARRRWDPSVSLSEYAVCLGGTPVASSQWTPLYGKGTFQFSTAHAAGTWTVDVPWLATSYLTYAKAFSVTANVDTHDVTAFSTASTGRQWRSFLPGLSNVDVTVSRFVPGGTTGGTTAPVMVDRALLNLPFYLELILNSTDQGGYVGYGYISNIQGSESVDQIAAEEISFKVSGPLYYTT